MCLENNRLSLDSYPKAIAWEKRNTEVASQRRSSAKVLMTEPDIAHSAKEMFGAQVVYVFALHVELA